MALARLALKNLQQRVASSSSSLLSYQAVSERTLNSIQKQRWGSELLRRISSAAGEESSEGKQVAVSHGGKKSKLSTRRKRGRSLWKRDDDNFPPPLSEFFPSGLGNALVQATENINRLLGNLSPSRFLGKVKEQEDCYKLRYPVPGLTKDDIKVTVDNGILTIKGEHKEEEESDDDEHWSSFYGYYNTSLLLPEDAKVDEIKAEMKDGVLIVVIPRTEAPKKDVKEISVH